MDSKEYGIANILPSVGYVIFALVTAKLSNKYTQQAIIRVGIIILVFGVLWMFLALFMHVTALISLFIPITIIYFGEVLIYPNTSALAMRTVTDTAHASAVMNFFTIALPVIAVLSMALFSIHYLLLPIVFAVICAIIVGVYRWVVKSSYK